MHQIFFRSEWWALQRLSMTCGKQTRKNITRKVLNHLSLFAIVWNCTRKPKRNLYLYIYIYAYIYIIEYIYREKERDHAELFSVFKHVIHSPKEPHWWKQTSEIKCPHESAAHVVSLAYNQRHSDRAPPLLRGGSHIEIWAHAAVITATSLCVPTDSRKRAGQLLFRWRSVKLLFWYLQSHNMLDLKGLILHRRAPI